MQIGEVIRKYRKAKNLTQEETALRLGVTAPAVNKWENGNSLPDITLLAPIARLLGISLDTLLSFHEELTTEEINGLIYELDAMFKEKTYSEVFSWAREKLQEYPNCERLLWQTAVILDAQLMVQKVPDSDKYEGYVHSLYVRALKSNEEDIRTHAADSLFSFYMRKEQYDKAEEYLTYFSQQNPERKRKQAQIYEKTDRIPEAYKTYEELLFSYYQMVNAALYGINGLALQEKDMKKAHDIVAKQEEMARCFEMGKYYETSCKLELATLEKDVDAVISIMRDMLAATEQIGSFCESPLYEHMEFKGVREGFKEELKQDLCKSFQDEENFGFLKDDKRWRELAGKV
ncbi:MAG: helix-turn-helix domain-containing protein [Bacteroidales bacterium]|nr:helix-turn-helix domain-containing protein [Lachnoclostridium sp.]MCM1384478.1 helix-turn-helix domain-containing protein [Lachnoclostridium sp.]MCM1464023.1 helix-turn-helix domain-containing protein [Bacteroidales bacterium]